MRLLTLRLLALFALLLAACDQPSSRPATSHPANQPSSHPATQPSRIVDSIFPIEEEIRRFQAGLPPVTALSGGAPSRDELVHRFVTALEDADRSAFAPLMLDQSEFGYLYFPESRFTRKPYRTKPGLVWFQIQNASSKGIGRALTRLGGRPMGFRDYRCAAEPVVEGKNTLWEACTVSFRAAGTDSVRTMRLFGPILERDGVFKFMGYGNDF